MAATNDIELWKHFKEGDRQAFALLFRNYYKLLYQYGSRITPDKDGLEDCIQEMFLELWQRREHLADAESVKAYLFKVLKTKLYKAKIQAQQFSEISESNVGLHEFSHEALLVAEQADLDLKLKFERALTYLSKRQREAVYLKFYNKMSYEEICVVMGVNYQTVRNLIHQSIKSLRETLTKEHSLFCWILCLLNIE